MLRVRTLFCMTALLCIFACTLVYVNKSDKTDVKVDDRARHDGVGLIKIKQEKYTESAGGSSLEEETQQEAGISPGIRIKTGVSETPKEGE